MLVKTESWGSIVDNTNDGNKYILDTDGFLNIEDGEKQEDGLTYFFTIGLGYRDESGDIIELEGEEYEDISSRIIHLTITFEKKVFVDNEYNTKIYINNWNTQKLSQDTYEDFQEGDGDGTEIIEEGFIELTKLTLEDIPDWCLPQHTHSKFDLPGQGEGTSLTSSPGNAYITTGRNASGKTFLHAEISSTNPPAINLGGEFHGSGNAKKGNDVYVDGDYVYVATDSNSRSVLIIDIKSLPFTEIGYYGTGANNSARTVYTQGNHGFVGWENKIDIFNISQKVGQRNRISTISIGTNSTRIEDIVVKNDHIFATLSNHSSQLVIINISNINNPQIVSQMQLNNVSGNVVFVSQDTNTAYVGTAESSSHPEFFVINTTNKSNPSLISSFDTNGMHIVDLVIVENRAILGGHGTNNYIVLELDNIENLNKCGELLIPGNILALDVVEHDEKLFTYILTGDSAWELQIIEGGAGIAGIIGDDYVNYGEYFSQIFDSELANLRFYSVHLHGGEPQGTNLKAQLRSSQQPDLSDAQWFGPDGTENSYFTLGENEINLPTQQGPYFQYKVEMTSENYELSPILNKIEITYE